MRRTEALSLLEIILAFTILTLASIPLMNVFSTSARQTRQTSQYGLALGLSQKVAEELRVSAWENRHVGDRVRDLPPAVRSVVGDDCPALGAIEDLVAPRGRLRDGQDPGITPLFRSLHGQLDSFRLRVTSRTRSLPTTGDFLEAGVSLEWTDSQSKTQKLVLDVPLTQSQPARRTTLVTQEVQEVDRLVQEQVFPGRSDTTLESLVRDANADLEAVRTMGLTELLARQVKSAGTEHAAELARLSAELATATGESQARLQLALARTHERRAAHLLLVMGELSRRQGTVPASPTVRPLGDIAVPTAVRSSILGAATIPSEFATEMARARTGYSRAHNPPMGSMLPRRLRQRTFLKLLDLTKLAVLTTTPGDLPLLDLLLQQFIEYQDGRNPHVHHFATREREVCRTVASLRLDSPEWRWRCIPGFLSIFSRVSRRL